MSVAAIVLAAGEGTRMRSDRPKPIHMICGRAMVLHVIEALHALRPTTTALVVGHGADRVMGEVSKLAPAWSNLAFVEQVTQRGTGDAAAYGMTALPGDDFDDDSTVVVLPGDAPLLLPETLDELVATHVANDNAATMLTSVLDDPTGYGRVIRGKDGDVVGIVEQRDATPEQLQVREVGTSIYAFRRDLFGPALRQLSPDNAQGEYYLTDVVGMLAGMGHRVGTVEAPATETQGVNDRWQLALAERELRSRTNRGWLLNGVTMLDPRQTFIDVTVQLGRDVTLYPGVMLQGSTVVGNRCEIGPSTRLVDCRVGDDVRIQFSVGEQATIAPGTVVGPFAHLGPSSAL
ncbi:bifunctional N-acetylglucosamine-1-phosphate uridyltransferase/glucosamine-1-phosphate acetyltransferase [Desertimonas flava]|uniref:bifunctional UDP-N-acetylglucosamine diphosphorylase/glucosamine-1-phosphate N-acetyltransferase GlmU n=1 Tax=Desertimonas flava TaxID=2064846 RepID=UPI0013C49242|nr:NTP transferase domain-containing protein [Desertimonas flava]